MVGLARAAPVEDAALIEAETGVAVNGHGERPVFDEGLFELGDGRQLVRLLFVDVAPGQRAVIGCQYSVAVGGQAGSGNRGLRAGPPFCRRVLPCGGAGCLCKVRPGPCILRC